MSESLEQTLLQLLGPAGFLRLVERHGGTRLYVPESGATRSDLVREIGQDAVEKLAGRYARDYIRVPLAREFRARHYRAVESLSNRAIALRLGITETGVDKLFARMPAKPKKGSADPRQLKLFA